MESGLFVSLAEKIARRPEVRSLVGTPLSRVSVVKDLEEDSQRYDRKDPTKNHSLTTFDERARQIPQFAIHEEDASAPPQAFPGTRFGSWKEGAVPFMNHWDGGKQSYLSPRFMPGFLRRNYEWLLDRGVRPDGVYLDVFGYVPPDEDWNPEHPATRSDNLRARAACYRWPRERLGIVGTEAACDWTIPYADISSPLRPARVVPVPRFELVYHDAVLTTYNATDLRGLLHAGVPQAGFDEVEKNLDAIRRMAALNERLAQVEMTKHEFLDAARRRERTTFADGTTVTVDWDTHAVIVVP